MKRDWKAIAGMLMGIAIAVGTFISHQFSTAEWSAKSSLLFLLGIIICILSLLYREDNFLGSLVNTKLGRMYISSAFVGGCILLIYIWVISIGTWTNYPATTNYYDLLASAFGHGQLSLETKPDPALLALDNPYDPKYREGIPVLWDMALYKGEYYLYWGPVSALLLALVKPFYSTPVTDNLLTLIFLAGLLIFQTLLILELWKSYFQETPGWVTLLSISFTGLINPILYMLLEPRIYEAAVAAAQFFFIGGLYWLFTAYRKPSLINLALAGVFFTLAVGSRTTTLIPIAFLVGVALVWAIKSHPAKAVAFITALALPLALGTVSYGWYNYQRFESLTEFGLGYQLSQTDMHETLDETFSLAYTPPNLFKLLVNPFDHSKNFPYIKATPWGGPAWFENYKPKIYDYFAEDITGILVASPFLLFALLAATGKQKNIHWITSSLAGASLLIFFTLLAFFYLTMRYLLDLVPVLSLLALIGFWQGLHLLQPRQTARSVFVITGIVLWVYSILASFILCYSSNLHRIRIYNLELVQNITWTFTHIFK